MAALSFPVVKIESLMSVMVTQRTIYCDKYESELGNCVVILTVSSISLWGRKRVKVNTLNSFKTYMIQCPLWGF
jgi:hypothetical protein